MERCAGADGAGRAADLRCARHSARHRRIGGGRCRRSSPRGDNRLRHAAARRVHPAAPAHDIMTRLEATRVVVEAAGEAPIVASLGHPAYDLFAAGDRGRNFYTWGSMGVASSIGLGLALARADLRVFVLDGDGSLLMNLGSLATIGLVRPENLVLIVWDNGEYGTTGGQDTATRHGADLEASARAMSMTSTATVRTAGEFDAAIARAKTQPGPWTIVVKVAETIPTVKPPLDYVM